LEQSVAFFQDEGLRSIRTRLEADQNPSISILQRPLKAMTEMIMKAASESITDHCPFADLTANNNGTTANGQCFLTFKRSAIRAKKPRHRRSFTESHQRSMEALSFLMQMIKTAVSTQSHCSR
jgi:hypothetical protein